MNHDHRRRTDGGAPASRPTRRADRWHAWHRGGRIALTLLGLAGSAHAWDASSPSVFFPSRFDTEYFASVARQPDGGSIVAGTHGHPNVGGHEWDCTFVAARIAEHTGAVDWRTEIADCGDDETYAFNPNRSPGEEIVRVDAAGDALVARFRAAGSLLEVVKLDGASGAVLWRQTVARPGERNATTHAMALDPSGDVVVAGGDGTSERVPTDLFVAKLDGASGAERWRHELRGTSTDDDARNRADAVAVDAAGNVVVHGVLHEAAAESTAVPVPVLLAIDGASGEERWRADGLAVAADVLFAGSGDVLLAGGGKVTRIDGATGDARWRTRFGTTPPATGEYRAYLALHGDTVAVAADAASVGEERSILFVTLDTGTGAQRWQRTIDTTDVVGPISRTDRAAGVGLDAAGNVVVAATIVDGAGVTRPLVAAFDGVRGDELWRRSFAGTAAAHAGAFDLLVDGDDATVVGGVGRAGAFTDAFAARLATATGAQAWIEDDSAILPDDHRGLWLDEIAHDAAVDARGDVVAVGQTWSGVERIDFAVRKLAGATGATLWRDEQPRTFGIPLGLFSFAPAERVALDGRGDAVVLSGRFPTTLVKHRAADGSAEWTSSVTASPATADPLARPLAIDGAGDVLVNGSDFRVVEGRFGSVMVVKKLAGTSGAELWDAAVPARAAISIALDPADDVLAVGQGSDELRETLVVKYAGDGGAELWRHRSTSTLLPELLLVDDAGDPLVGTRRDAGNGLALGIVLKLDGASGRERWQSADLWGATRAIAVDGAGDVLATGNSSTFAGDGLPLVYQAAAAKLDGTTGRTLWRRTLAGLGDNVEVVAAVADANGDLVVAAREVPGRTWLAGLRGGDGTLAWTIALGEPGTTFDVRALRLRAPGQVVVAGGRTTGDEGSAFAVLGLDVRDVVGPPTRAGRSCVVRLPETRGPATSHATAATCTGLSGRIRVATQP